jgi:hypothetical protein
VVALVVAAKRLLDVASIKGFTFNKYTFARIIRTKMGPGGVKTIQQYEERSF